MEGITSSKLADRKEGFSIPIRELMQNSLDASKEAGNQVCEINIYMETISKSQIPHIKEYEKVLKEVEKTAKKQGSYRAQQEQVIAKIKHALATDDIKILMFCDNGIGMDHAKLEALIEERSKKDSDSSGGSYGVGHLSIYFLSSLQYLLYATKYKEDDGKTRMLFTGSPILAGYDDGNSQRSGTGRIIEKIPDNEKKPIFTYPEAFPSFIQNKIHGIDTGTIVTILGLSKDWDKDAEYAIASNFFCAIAHGSLSVKIHKNNKIILLNHERVEELLQLKKDNQYAKRSNGEILSGNAVWHAWQAVQMPHGAHTINLSNNDNVFIYIKTDKHMDPSTISLVRSDMLVARHDSMISPYMNDLRQNPDFESFGMVIDVTQDSAPGLFSLVKLAEGPHHTSLERANLSKQKIKELIELLKELSKKIEEDEKILKKIKREAFDLPIFEIPGKATTQNQSINAKSETIFQPPEDKNREEESSEDDGNGGSSGSGSGRKNGKRLMNRARHLKAKIAARHKNIEGKNKWEVMLRIIPNDLNITTDDVYLSICLAEDSDDKSRTYLDFSKVEINGKSIDVPELDEEKEGNHQLADKSFVRLGQLKSEETYIVIAEVNEVEQQRNVSRNKVALLPYLWLKRNTDS